MGQSTTPQIIARWVDNREPQSCKYTTQMILEDQAGNTVLFKCLVTHTDGNETYRSRADMGGTDRKYISLEENSV